MSKPFPFRLNGRRYVIATAQASSPHARATVPDARGRRWLDVQIRRRGDDAFLTTDRAFVDANGRILAMTSALGFQATIGLRFARMVLVVPFVEELFWRGFLMRFLVDQDRPFQRIAFGTHRWRVFWIVTVAVMLIHNTSDWPAAFVWGALMYFVAVRTKSLGACIVMHAVGNLLLGLYVMKTGLWGFW